MKIEIPTKFVKPGENIFNGDIVRIKDEGTVVEGMYGPQLNFELELANGAVKTITLGTQTLVNLKKEFGDDSKDWIDKELKAWVYESFSKGKKKTNLILTPSDWNDAVSK